MPLNKYADTIDEYMETHFDSLIRELLSLNKEKYLFSELIKHFNNTFQFKEEVTLEFCMGVKLDESGVTEVSTFIPSNEYSETRDAWEMFLTCIDAPDIFMIAFKVIAKVDPEYMFGGILLEVTMDKVNGKFTIERKLFDAIPKNMC